MTPDVSIAISTKDRRDDLARALASCRRQRGDVEVVVVDDGSTDGTAGMVADRFPWVRLHAFETSAGYVLRRNFAATVARAPFVVSMDDDAELAGDDLVAAVRAAFVHPGVGAVTLPYVDVRQGPTVKQAAPPGGPVACASFVGTAHAVRRDVFLALGGYRTEFFHQGEEVDFCLRLLAAGRVVAMAGGEPLLHHESPRRDFRRVDVFGRRNDVLFAVLNVPSARLPLHLAGTTWNGIAFGVRQGRLAPMLRGLARGYVDGMRLLGRRRPVPAWAYRLHRELRKGGPRPLDDVLARVRAGRAAGPGGAPAASG